MVAPRAAIGHTAAMHAEYAALVTKVEAFTRGAFVRADMACARGCASCCQVWLTVDQVEAASLHEAIARLAPDIRERIAQRGTRELEREHARPAPQQHDASTPHHTRTEPEHALPAPEQHDASTPLHTITEPELPLPAPEQHDASTPHHTTTEPEHALPAPEQHDASTPHHTTTEPEHAPQRREQPAAPRCALLEDDGTCAVYEARPLVCRTQGFALRYPAGFIPAAAVRVRSAAGEITHCPLNFTERLPEPAHVLDAERVDQILAVVNQRYANGNAVDPNTRHAISALAAAATASIATSKST